MTEAKALARPGLQLVPEGTGAPVAFWHGISFDHPCITLHRDKSWISVSIDNSDSGNVTTHSDMPQSGLPLYPVPFVSLPPLDALFKFGSGLIERYLHENGWDRSEPFNNNFPDRSAHEYEQAWQSNCPMFSPSIIAVSGGWPFPWPEGDLTSLASSQLVVWTLAESEPWVEVFETNGQLSVLQRVT